ncbi:MAG: ABC transporter permease [Parachlamydiaceae bacterium]|nr:ABC transporter permease [Parachlamydiaceae bacterium]
MKILVIQKLAYACITLLLVATLTFLLMKWIPGDPFQQEQALPTAIYEALREHYGFNDSLPSQYFHYLKQLVYFDLGPSFIHQGRSVASIIKESMPISAALGAQALLLAIPAGILLGTMAALKKNRWQDYLTMFVAVIGISMPSFILATLLQYILAIKLELLPIARWGSLAQTILPTLSLATLPIAFIARMVRTKMIEELRQDYIKTARAKGLSPLKIIFKHALRNTLIPVFSYLGQLTANILTGSFIVEKIFSIPGLGYWFVMSVLSRDYTLIMGITLFYSAVLLAIMFFVDIVCIILDPRIAHSIREGKLS